MPDARLTSQLRMLDFSVLDHYRRFGMPVWVHDPRRHRHVWANDAALHLWNARSLDELLERRYDDMSPGALARLEVAAQAHARGETTRDAWTLYPGGRPTPTVLHGSGIVQPDGMPAILFVAEQVGPPDAELLRRAEALLHLPMLVAVLRINGLTPLMLNPAAELTLGRSDAKGFPDWFVDPAVPAALLAEVGAGRLYRVEAQLATRFGPRWYALDVRPAWDPVLGEPSLHLSAVDIDELKATQQQLLDARGRAEAASAAKSAFLANMSHELRTPLNGVLGMLQVTLRSTLDDRQRHWLQVAQSSGQLLLTLLNDLLDLSKIEAGRMEIDRTTFDLASLLDQTLTPLKLSADAKGLDWRVNVPARPPPALMGDPVRIRQVLFNLVGNAIKFTHEGSIVIDVGLRPADTPGRVDLAFQVSDTGIGIEPEHMARLFQPFMQADARISRRYGGSGLGLALVRRLVEAMEGEVVLDSRIGHGTQVRWTVRVAYA